MHQITYMFHTVHIYAHLTLTSVFIGGVQVWCGVDVVWCGVVWCGVVWYGGAVWCGVVWYGVVQMWCDMVWCGVA